MKLPFMSRVARLWRITAGWNLHPAWLAPEQSAWLVHTWEPGAQPFSPHSRQTPVEFEQSRSASSTPVSPTGISVPHVVIETIADAGGVDARSISETRKELMRRVAALMASSSGWIRCVALSAE